MDSNSSYGPDLIDPAFAGMSLAEVCALASRLQTQVRHTEALNAKLTHEMAVLKRLKFAATSERFSAEQKSLLEEAIDENLEALAREVDKLETTAKKSADKHTPKRQLLPADLPRRDVHHEPENTTCRTPGCDCQLKRIGEDISEKLNYLPAASQSSAMFEASGLTSNARRSSRRQCRHRSSTKASLLQA
jgi:transposase